MRNIYETLLEESIISCIEEKNAKPNITILEHTNDLLDVLDLLWELGYIKEERIYKLVQAACLYHDIGKINEEFQKRVNSKKLIRFNESKEVAHNVLSVYFIDDSKFDNREDYFRVVNAVINHHDYCDIDVAMSDKTEIIEKLLLGFEHKKNEKNNY